MLSKYKEIKINGAKKTVQIGDPSKGETVAIVKVKGYGTMKFKLFPQGFPAGSQKLFDAGIQRIL